MMMNMRVRILLIVALMAASCAKKYDDAELRRQLAEHDRRIAALENRLSSRDVRRGPVAAAPSAPFPTPVTTAPATLPTTTQAPAGNIRGAAAGELSHGTDPKLAIRAYCTQKWMSNWNMVSQCEKEESDALLKLLEGNTFDIPPDAYREIRDQCAREYQQYSLQANCQAERAEAAKRGE